MQNIRVDGSRFIDECGRHVLLHGVNLVCKDKAKNYVGEWNREDFTFLRNVGVNVIRLGLIWDGVEPSPCAYDDNYLAKIGNIIDLAKEFEIYVFLDMHQDLYSSLFSDGAPEWATITDKPFENNGLVWSDAYFTSLPVQEAFDNFWINAVISTGKGLQEHYVLAWQHVAKFFADKSNVIGFDIMNEPSTGTLTPQILMQMFSAFFGMAAECAVPVPSDILTVIGERGADAFGYIWLNNDSRNFILKVLGDKNIYQRVISSIEPILQQFDRDVLSVFQQKATAAIKEVAPNKIVFLETSYFGNMGAKSGIKRVEGMQQAYAPHGYDLVVDTVKNELHSPARVEYIFESHAEVCDTLQMPMLVGEWGAFSQNANGGGSGSKGQAEQIQKIFEKLLCSDTFWCYTNGGVAKQNLHGKFYSQSVVRAYPRTVAGELLAYSWDADANIFECKWLEKSTVNEATEIFIPDIPDFAINLSDSEYSVAKLGVTGAIISVFATKTDCQRNICIKPKA